MMDCTSASAQGFPRACDLLQLWAHVALTATLTMASTAQGISQRTFLLLSPPFSSSSPGSCFTGNAQGVMRHVPLFKGCFGYIRDFPFSFFFICCIFICLSVWVELHLLQFGLVPLREAAELTVIHCTTQTYNFNVISRIPDLFWSQR